MQVTETLQWTSGQSVEIFLDLYFTLQGWRIEKTSSYEERTLHLGDRRFIRPGKEFLVEYKSGLQTFHTGNIFLETVSVDTKNIPGWVYTCQADYIFYAALLNRKVLIFTPDKLRAAIPDLKLKFRETKTGNGQNKSYNTHGLIVPLEYAEANLAEKVIELALRGNLA